MTSLVALDWRRRSAATIDVDLVRMSTIVIGHLSPGYLPRSGYG